MKQFLLPITLITLTLFGCNSNTTSDKEKELLQKEIELLKREKDLLKNDSTILNENPKTEEENVEIKEVKVIDRNYLILDKSVGKFKIGNQIPFPETSDNYKVKKEIQTRMTEEGPEEETIYIVSENSEDLLMIKPEYDYETGNYNTNIGEIIVLSKKFRTLENIGVNSTIDEFTNAYPNFNIWYTYVSGMYVIDTKDIKAQFILNENDFTGKMNVTSDMTTLKKTDFKSTTSITKIRVI